MSDDPYAKMRVAAWRDALRVLLVQAIMMLGVGGLGAIFWDTRVGLGALVGAGIGLVANAYLAFAMLGKPLLTQKLGSLRLSWSLKVLFTLSTLWLVMRAKIVPPPALIGGLFASMVAHWAAGVFWLSRRR